jgi:hypothetical protein
MQLFPQGLLFDGLQCLVHTRLLVGIMAAALVGITVEFEFASMGVRMGGLVETGVSVSGTAVIPLVIVMVGIIGVKDGSCIIALATVETAAGMGTGTPAN